MSRNALLTQKIRDERQEQILYAALRVFARSGLAATKISDIAADANVSHGLVHHYFGSKEDIFTAVIEQAMQGANKSSEDVLHQAGTPLERLTLLCEDMLDGIKKHPEFVLLLIQAKVNDSTPEKARKLLDAQSGITNQNLASLIRAGQETGEIIGGDPTVLANSLTALIQGLALSRLHSDRGSTLPDASFVLRLLKA